MKMIRAYWKKMPFDLFIGIEIVNFSDTDLVLRLNMKEELVGNYRQGDLLHGGVTASILDTVGGILASICLVNRAMESPTPL